MCAVKQCLALFSVPYSESESLMLIKGRRSKNGIEGEQNKGANGTTQVFSVMGGHFPRRSQTACKGTEVNDFFGLRTKYKLSLPTDHR